MMGKYNLRVLSIVVLLAVIMLTPAISCADDIAVDFGRTCSVTVTKAKVVDISDHQLKLVGQLRRPHRLPMVGHLHAYTYMKNGDMASDSKHHVLGLYSQRGGSMKLPFKISIKNGSGKIDRVYLEYHSPGHPET